MQKTAREAARGWASPSRSRAPKTLGSAAGGGEGRNPFSPGAGVAPARLESRAVALSFHDAVLAGRVETFLKGVRGSDLQLLAMAPLAGGACQDMHRLELATAAGPVRLVLRSDARSSLPASLGRREEFAVVEAARAAGVPTPGVHHLTQGLLRPGAWAYFMDWVEGEALGRRVVRAPELAGARARLPAQLAQALARLHTVSPSAHPSLFARTVPLGPVRGGLTFVRGMLDTLREPAAFAGWLAQIARNRAIDHLRKRPHATAALVEEPVAPSTGIWMKTPTSIR